jgi:hypothetical protein
MGISAIILTHALLIDSFSASFYCCLNIKTVRGVRIIVMYSKRGPVVTVRQTNDASLFVFEGCRKNAAKRFGVNFVKLQEISAAQLFMRLVVAIHVKLCGVPVGLQPWPLSGRVS